MKPSSPCGAGDALGDGREVGGWERVGLAPPRLGGVLAGHARHAEDALRDRVVGLQVGVPEGPARAGVAHDLTVHLEVLLAEAERDAPVEHRGPTDVEVGPEIPAAPELAVGRLAAVVPGELAHVLLGPVLGSALHPAAALEHEHAPAGLHQLARGHGAAEAAADDDRVVGLHGPKLVGGRRFEQVHPARSRSCPTRYLMSPR